MLDAYNFSNYFSTSFTEMGGGDYLMRIKWNWLKRWLGISSFLVRNLTYQNSTYGNNIVFQNLRKLGQFRQMIQMAAKDLKFFKLDGRVNRCMQIDQDWDQLSEILKVG